MTARPPSIRHALALALALSVALVASSAWGYRLSTDHVAGGNPKLAKKTYKVYIQANAANPAWRDEVVSALGKWKAELEPRGVDLALQAGDPPAPPQDVIRRIRAGRTPTWCPGRSPSRPRS